MAELESELKSSFSEAYALSNQPYFLYWDDIPFLDMRIDLTSGETEAGQLPASNLPDLSGGHGCPTEKQTLLATRSPCGGDPPLLPAAPLAPQTAGMMGGPDAVPETCLGVGAAMPTALQTAGGWRSDCP